MDDVLTLTEVTKRFTKLFGYVGATFKDCDHCGKHVWHVPRGGQTVLYEQCGRLHQLGNEPAPQGSDEERFVELYTLLGAERRPCKTCGQPIFMIVTTSGGRMPMTVRGISHFADCPNASYHRRAR